MNQHWAQGPFGAQSFSPVLPSTPQIVHLLQSVPQQLQQLQQIEYVRLQQLQQIQQLVQYIAHQLAQPYQGTFAQPTFGQPYQSVGGVIPGSWQTSPLQVM
jgi:hypothetical protein